jgi:hypothetical protein
LESGLIYTLGAANRKSCYRLQGGGKAQWGGGGGVISQQKRFIHYFKNWISAFPNLLTAETAWHFSEIDTQIFTSPHNNML